MRAKIRYRKWKVLLADILLNIIVFALASLLEKDILLGRIQFWWGVAYGAVAVIVPIVCLYFLQCYRIIWRYAGILEVLNVFGAYVISTVLLIFIQPAFFRRGEMSISFVFLYNCFSFLCALASRYFPRILDAFKRLFQGEKYREQVNVVVFGAGYTGAALVKRFIENPEDGYNPVAIIDDDFAKQKTVVSGVRVAGGRDCLQEVLKKYKANTVMIAITKLTKEELRAIYDYVKQYKVDVKVATSIAGAQGALNSETVSIKNINIVDLLRREARQFDQDLLDGMIKDKVVMVTGGAGSIGSELCRQALRFGCKRLVIFDQNEFGMFELNEELKLSFHPEKYVLVMGTVRDKVKLETTMETYRPDIVFHAAAYKHVPMMELAADEAIKNNVFGTKNVIEQCEKSGVGKFILISTDKAVNPANIMGATKRMAELIIEDKARTSKTVLAAVRFGNVLGSSGSVIPTFIRQINQGGPVTVTHEKMKRYFMTIPEAVTLVLQAGGLAKGGEVFVLDMGEPVYISDLAKDLIRMSGFTPDKEIKICYTGLRPGEKLFEELRFGNEDVDRTRHDDIFVCKLENVDHEALSVTLADLARDAEAGDKNAIESDLFTMIPSIYRNRDSKDALKTEQKVVDVARETREFKEIMKT